MRGTFLAAPCHLPKSPNALNKTAVRREPFYRTMLQVIERGILKVDRKAQEAGISINDSQVHSILTKLRKTATGSVPALRTGPPSEKTVAGAPQHSCQGPPQAFILTACPAGVIGSCVRSARPRGFWEKNPADRAK